MSSFLEVVVAANLYAAEVAGKSPGLSKRSRTTHEVWGSGNRKVPSLHLVALTMPSARRRENSSKSFRERFHEWCCQSRGWLIRFPGSMHSAHRSDASGEWRSFRRLSACRHSPEPVRSL